MRTKKRFWLCKCGEVYFTHDTTNGERKSLNTRDAREAEQLINAKNVAVEQPGINLALALGLGWLPWPVLQPTVWPKIKPKAKRGITLEEHQRIIACEKNQERRLFY